MPHLWEIDHPYYCSDHNFRARPSQDNSCHLRWGSWRQFAEDGWGDSDPDMNLLFRWDWQRADPDDCEDDEELPSDELELFFMLQRKGDFWAHTIAVTDADESAVRAWLTERAKTITALWRPFDLQAEVAR